MNSLLSLAGWSIIPDLATRYLLNFIYSTPFTVTVLRITRGTPGTPQYRRHYGVTFAIVVLGYLLYTMIEKANSMPPNFYQILGVPHTVDENGLKLAFRQFAKRNHPDRPEIGKKGEALFMFVRDAFEALKDPAVRFAYDRFGPDALKWRQQCRTSREFLRQGLMASSGYHIVAALVLLFWSAVGQPSPMVFWRYILFAFLLVAELALILAPSPSLTLTSRTPTVLQMVFPGRIVYQHILFLHQLFMFISVALSRVAPYLLPYDEFADPRFEQHLLDRTTALVAHADRETSKMIHTELQSISQPFQLLSPMPHRPSLAQMQPVTPNTASEILMDLAPEMEAIVMEANLNKDSGPLKSAWEAAVARAHAKSLERQSREVTPTPTPQLTRNFWEGHVDTNGIEENLEREALRDVIKTEEGEVLVSANDGVGGSGYFVITPSTQTPSRRSMKSVPHTPGELPSPRPSPSPPPFARSPSMFRVTAPRRDHRDLGPSPKGYFSKGLSKIEEEGERVRARSVSC